MSEQIPLIVGVVSLAVSIYAAGYKMGRIEEKLNILWDFTIRRATVEAYQRGMITFHSPEATLTSDVIAKYFPSDLIQDIKTWYGEHGVKLSDRDLFISLEKNFGDEMVEKVCLPHGLDKGACILAASFYCRTV